MSQHKPSDIQQEIYKFLLKTLKEIGRPPSRVQIRENMGFRTTSHVQHHLQMLEKAGWIELLLNEDYGIRLLKRGIPLVGYIAAGQPIESFIEPDQMIDLGPELEDERNYVLIVKGNSMIDDGIFDRDYIVIRRQNTCEYGEVMVAVQLPEPFRATLKRFTREDGKVCLKPANSEVGPIYIPYKEWYDEWQIQGIVIAVYRQYPRKHHLNS